MLYQTQVIVTCKETTVLVTLYERESKLSLSQKSSYIEKILNCPFDNNPTKLILIEGAPGIGKTTLCLDIVNSWSKNELVSCKLLLLIHLRDPYVQKISTPQEFTKYVIKSGNGTDLLYNYLENKGNVTILLDGFDEINNKAKDSFLCKLIKGDYFPNARIVVTSRPSASAWLHNLVDQRVEILGFNRSSREQYITESLKNFPLKHEKLQKHLTQYPNIDAICYSPLVVPFIIFVTLHQPDELPRTVTEMYHSFIVHKISEYLKAQSTMLKDKKISGMQEFLHEVQEAVQKLQKLAFTCLVEDKFVFNSEEVPNSNFGLLQSVEHHYNVKSFKFIDFSMQEFLAAYYVANLAKVKDDQTHLKVLLIFKECGSEDIRFYNMWIFYYGLSSAKFRCAHLQCKQHYSVDLFQSNIPFQPNWACYCPGICLTPSDPQLFALTIPGLLNHPYLHMDVLRGCSVPWKEPTPIATNTDMLIDPVKSLLTSENFCFPQEFFSDAEKIFYLFQCFKEAQNDAMCEHLSKSFQNNSINLKDRKLVVPRQVESLGLFLTSMNCKELILFNCQIGDYGIILLHRYLCRDAKKRHHFAIIDFMKNNLTESSLPFIGDIIIYAQPDTLKIGSNDFVCVNDITTAVISSRLRVLNLFDCSLTVQGAKTISDMMTTLEELNISNNYLSNDGAKIISEGLIKTISLKVLYINNNNINSHGVVSIAYSLSLNTSLVVLNMTNNVIRQDGVVAIVEAISKNRTLKELLLWGNCTLNEESAILLLQKLYNGKNVITRLGFPKKLASNNCINNYIESINVRRRSHGQQDIKFELY